MQTYGLRVVLNLFRETIGQSRKPPHAHPHCEILSLNVARRDMLRVRVSSAAKRLCAVDLRRTVPTRRMWNFTVELDQLRVIYFDAKRGLDCTEIGSVPIAGDLHAIG